MSAVLTPTNADLGHAIRRLRRGRRRTIEDLAFDAGTHPTYLSGIERGIRNPTWGKLCGVARALDVSLAVIFAGAEREALIATRMHEARAELDAEGL